MKRREFLARTGLGLAAAARSTRGEADTQKRPGQSAAGRGGKITPPARGKIPVAFVVSEGATVIDFAGPWEVFQDVMIPERGPDHHGDQTPFRLYTVSDGTAPITASAGMKIVPDYTFSNAPAPRVIVIPAQGGRSPGMIEWIKSSSRTADVTMSVCTGAFLLAATGLLSGRPATTHHLFLDRFARQFPDVEVRRGLRFVEGEKLATAGGLTSGIDLALRVVERYFGREAASRTAEYMEYQSRGWVV